MSLISFIKEAGEKLFKHPQAETAPLTSCHHCAGVPRVDLAATSATSSAMGLAQAGMRSICPG